MHGKTTTHDGGEGAAQGTRRVEVEKLETRVLGLAGGGLLALAAVFLWRELAVPAEVVLVVATVAAVVAAGVLSRLRVPLVGPAVLLGATGLGALWYGATREPLLLVGLGAAFAGTVALAVMARRAPAPESPTARWHRLLAWHGVALSGLVTSFAFYFQLFDASDLSLQHFVARRALLSLSWLAAGVALVLRGRSQRAGEVRDAGFVVLAAGVAKLLVYDTTHLDGLLRVGALAVGGAVLLGSAAVVRRLHAGGR
jgi:hypothetical protein